MKKIIFVIVLIIVSVVVFGLLKYNNKSVAEPLRNSLDSTRSWKTPKAFVYDDPNPFVGNSLREFEAFIKTAIANRQAAGAAVAILKDTSIILLKGYGLREFGKPDSVDEQTVFRIGSVSKSVTATLCAALVSDSLLNWDDPVIKYLPDFKLKTEDATKKLTLRHLLSHTEGLPYHAYTDMVDQSAPVDTLIGYLKNLNLIAEPGKIYSYQNVGFSLIGKVIEAATKKSFEEVLTGRLFKPLKMKSASASFEKIMASKNVAQPHQLTSPLKISSSYYSVAPAGGINASAQDMALWLKEILTQKSHVLTEQGLDDIFEPQVRAVVRNLYFFKWKRVRKSYYGLGWRVINFADDTLAYHGGFVNNYRCEVAVDRKKKIAIAILVNSPGILADQGIPLFMKIYDHYLDSLKKWKPKPAS